MGILHAEERRLLRKTMNHGPLRGSSYNSHHAVASLADEAHASKMVFPGMTKRCAYFRACHGSDNDGSLSSV